MKTAIIKEVKSNIQILDETTLFLHRKAENLPDGSKETLVKLHQSDAMIETKKVIAAENGHDAIKILEETPDIKIVLMDIMMPVMDGYETTRTIRENPEFQ